MNKSDFLQEAHDLLERIEESIVKRKAHKSNDTLFTEAEIYIVEEFLKEVFADCVCLSEKRGLDMD